MSSFAHAAGRSVLWLAAGQAGKRLTQIITTAVLAHLLGPKEFGVVGLSAVVLDFAIIFRDLGTSTAVIRRSEIDAELLNTIFWANLGFAVIVACVISVGAPWAAQFFSEPALARILPVLSISFVIAGGSILQQALLERQMAFVRLAKAEMASALLGALAGIACAYGGLGVWSLVAQALTSQTLQSLLLWRASEWRPAFVFQGRRLIEISEFSLNLAGSQIIGFIWRNADNILIGRFLGATALGYYSIAYRIMLYPLQSVSHVVGRALFPVYARLQHDSERLRSAFVRATGAIAMLTFPMMIGLMVIRDTFVDVVLGPEWKPVAVLILILAPVGMSQSIGTLTGTIFQATGRTDWMLRWAVFDCTVSIIGYAIGLRWGIVGVALVYSVVNVLLFYPSFAYPFGLVRLPWRDFLKPLAPPLAASSIMAAFIALAQSGLAAQSGPLRLVLLVVTGIVTYLLALYAINRGPMRQTWRLILPASAKQGEG